MGKIFLNYFWKQQNNVHHTIGTHSSLIYNIRNKLYNRKELDFFLILKESLVLITYEKETNIYYLNLLHNLQFNQ